MNYDFINESAEWKLLRNRRIAVFVSFCNKVMIVSGLIWPFVNSTIWLAIITFMLLSGSGIVSLILLKKGHLDSARILSAASAIIYFVFVCIVSSGGLSVSSGERHVQFWLVVLASLSNFFFYDLKPWIRDTIPALLLLLFLMFHFDLVHIPAMVKFKNIYTMNLYTVTVGILTLYLINRLFSGEIIRAEESVSQSADQMEALLGNMLPKSIAQRLKSEKRTFADEFHDCSVLFADIEGFTSWAENKSPNDVAVKLNTIFSLFDELVDKAGLTKIKTIGDAYMVAAGAPEKIENHATALVELAKQILIVAKSDGEFRFRIGIHSGSVVAGIIGKKTFNYDLWGDTVNIASRMESLGKPNEINISNDTFNLIKNEFECKPNGSYETRLGVIKEMWLVKN
ncbi:MAG: adenylate/guanylate cyclase domain-containing protein [Bacteroidota bacterium]